MSIKKLKELHGIRKDTSENMRYIVIPKNIFKYSLGFKEPLEDVVALYAYLQINRNHFNQVITSIKTLNYIMGFDNKKSGTMKDLINRLKQMVFIDCDSLDKTKPTDTITITLKPLWETIKIIEPYIKILSLNTKILDLPNGKRLFAVYCRIKTASHNATKVNLTSKAVIKYESIARSLGYSKNSISKYVTELNKNGYLQIIKKYNKGNKPNDCNIYVLHNFEDNFYNEQVKGIPQPKHSF